MADNNEQSRGEVSIKINVDVSEALTGLKAVQREAREAAKALRELEEAHKKAGSIPIFPFEVHPDTPGEDTPEHVKKYGKGEGWTNKGGNGGKAWFGTEPTTQSITDDIRRCYE